MSKNLVQNNQTIEQNNEFLFCSATYWKRILAFLADFFINFILTILLFELVCFPIAKACIGYDTKVNDITTYHHARVDLMYDNNFLFYSETQDENGNIISTNKYDIDESINDTATIFLKFYTFKDESSEYSDPIITYWSKVSSNKKSISQINELYFDSVGKSTYFTKDDVDSNGYLNLKSEYKEHFKAYFSSIDSVSDAIKKEINDITTYTFKYNYQVVITDFASNNELYLDYSNKINAIYKEFDMYYQIMTATSFVISSSILFLLIPLINKRNRTIGKMIMKLDVVSNKNFKYLKKGQVFILYILNLLENLAFIMFVPFISAGFNNLFNLSYLMTLSIVSILYCLANVIISLINQYNYSLKEMLSRTIVCEEELIDTYYREIVYAKSRE